MSDPVFNRSTLQSTALPLRDSMTVHLPALRARALKLCRNRVEAEDLVQDTVLRALRFEQTFERGTNLRAWLQQILMSVFVTRCRRNSRERKALSWLVSDPCAWTHADAPPVALFLGRRVEHAVDALPPKFAEAVRLVDLGEQSYREAADTLGVPVGTVMSRLFRGRRLLAAALTEQSLPAAA